MAKKLQIFGLIVILVSIAALFILIYNIKCAQNHIDNKKKVGTSDGQDTKGYNIEIKNENTQKTCVDNNKLKITCDPKKVKLIPKDNEKKNTNSKINKMIAKNTKQLKNSDKNILKQKRLYSYVILTDKKQGKKTNKNGYKKITKKVTREKKIRKGSVQSQNNLTRINKEYIYLYQFNKYSKRYMNGYKSSSSYLINTLSEVDQIKNHKILNENMIIKNVDNNLIVKNKIKENLFCFEKKNVSCSDDITKIKRSINNKELNKYRSNNTANFCKDNGNHNCREETSFKGFTQCKMTKYKKQNDVSLTIRKENKINCKIKNYERINQTSNKKCINCGSIDLIDYENLLENNKTYNFSINIKNKFFPSQNSDICKQYDLFIKSNKKLEKNNQNKCAECLFKYKNLIKHAIKKFNNEFIYFFGFKHAKKIEDRIISFTKTIENDKFFVNLENFLIKVNYHKNSHFLRKHTLSNIYYQKHVFNIIFAMKTLLKTITTYKNKKITIVLDTNEVSYVNHMFRTLNCQDITQAYKYVYNIEFKKTHKELEMVEIYFRPKINTLKLLSNRPKDEVLLIKDYFKNYLTQEILEMPIKNIIDVVDKFLTEHKLNDKYKEDSDTGKYNYITYEIYIFRDYEEKCLAKKFKSHIYNI